MLFDWQKRQKWRISQSSKHTMYGRHTMRIKFVVVLLIVFGQILANILRIRSVFVGWGKFSNEIDCIRQINTIWKTAQLDTCAQPNRTKWIHVIAMIEICKDVHSIVYIISIYHYRSLVHTIIRIIITIIIINGIYRVEMTGFNNSKKHARNGSNLGYAYRMCDFVMFRW